MFSFSKPINPCANPAGIKIDNAFLSERIILKCFPNVFDLGLRSTAISKIFPLTTDTNFCCFFFYL